MIRLEQKPCRAKWRRAEQSRSRGTLLAKGHYSNYGASDAPSGAGTIIFEDQSSLTLDIRPLPGFAAEVGEAFFSIFSVGLAAPGIIPLLAKVGLGGAASFFLILQRWKCILRERHCPMGIPVSSVPVMRGGAAPFDGRKP